MASLNHKKENLKVEGEYIKKTEGLVVGKDMGDSYPTVLLDKYVDENDGVVLVTVLKFDDYVIQYHLKVDGTDSDESNCDLFITNLETDESRHYQTVYCDNNSLEEEPCEQIVGQA